MVTIQSDLHKRKGWNPAVSVSGLEKSLAAAFQTKAPVSEAMQQWGLETFGLGSWHGSSTYLLLRF